MGRSGGRQRELSMAAYGEIPMAAVSAGLRGQGPRRSAARLHAVVFAYEHGIVVAGDPG
jgi:hypothetical protein